MKTIFEVIAQDVCDKLNGIPLEVLSAEHGEQFKRDDSGNKTEEIEKFLRLGLEVPRGNGNLSRAQFSVKLPDQEVDFDENTIDEELILVRFQDLKITFVDSRKNLYFKASDYELVEVHDND